MSKHIILVHNSTAYTVSNNKILTLINIMRLVLIPKDNYAQNATVYRPLFMIDTAGKLFGKDNL